MKVYLSIKESDTTYGVKILAVSASKSIAIKRCLSEYSFSKDKWMEDPLCENSWHNGYGLRVKVLEYNLTQDS